MGGGGGGGGGGGRKMQINACPFRMYRIRRPCNGRALWIFARNQHSEDGFCATAGNEHHTLEIRIFLLVFSNASVILIIISFGGGVALFFEALNHPIPMLRVETTQCRISRAPPVCFRPAVAVALCSDLAGADTGDKPQAS